MHEVEGGERGEAGAKLAQIEGALLAQRKLLVRLAARAPEAAALLDWLEDRAVLQADSEDPGALPSIEFAQQAAVAEEMAALARALRERMALPG